MHARAHSIDTRGHHRDISRQTRVLHYAQCVCTRAASSAMSRWIVSIRSSGVPGCSAAATRSAELLSEYLYFHYCEAHIHTLAERERENWSSVRNEPRDIQPTEGTELSDWIDLIAITSLCYARSQSDPRVLYSPSDTSLQTSTWRGWQSRRGKLNESGCLCTPFPFPGFSARAGFRSLIARYIFIRTCTCLSKVLESQLFLFWCKNSSTLLGDQLGLIILIFCAYTDNESVIYLWMYLMSSCS